MPPVVAVRPSAVPLRSVALILVSMFCFALVDALAKSLALAYPANEVTFFRMLFGLFPALAMCLRGKPLATRLRQLDVRGQTLRALTLLGASGLFFAGLPYMPLSEAVAIVYSETLLVIVLAPLLLHETLKPRDALAAAVGFAGMLLVVRPDGSHANWLGPALLIASALCGALSIIQIKRIKASDDSGTTVLYFTLVGTAVMGASLVFAWRTPSFDALAIMALLGALATAGQLLMTMAFRDADAGALAPYNYTSIVWAALFGYLVWGETIGAISMLGIALIVGSSIAVAMRRKPEEGPLV
ncbi:drug/metabolite transporter (DMT)-like permease [Paraburkholderia sp. HC6.4b]|uniref:DMT family transporter n=1 Tax=unclassified Paraburkholderia TaxID=2615204 RepID=UPI00161CB4ED|nr:MULTISPECIES: DMT family transporter [unclassified Paraburkholderia]MBB5408408.1 drug/metabolite transporter (DMT)-like permease [Paraburkholderia sp. HC6.4b]MBB5451513.1 drug/metabolite transporter (DMT)-like permease [Paraburkholderia sp. Kb1A]